MCPALGTEKCVRQLVTVMTSLSCTSYGNSHSQTCFRAGKKPVCLPSSVHTGSNPLEIESPLKGHSSVAFSSFVGDGDVEQITSYSP
jgi:hypothetical protein